MVGWLSEEKFKDIAILEDKHVRDYSERSPTPWINTTMNNPFKDISAGDEFVIEGITFKH